MKVCYQAAILICSDRSFQGERPDLCGPRLATRLKALDWSVSPPEILPDDRESIRNWLRQQVDSGNADLILTSGGTGLGIRDVTPEATLDVIGRQIPGLPEAMRQSGSKTTPYALLSRAVAGVAGRTLIINLPGNPEGALQSLETILPALPHALELIRGNHPDL